MLVKRITIMAGVCLALSAPQAYAQAIVAAPVPQLGISPVRAKGAEVRRVAPEKSAHLAYEYQTDAGPARISIDPTSLVGDIEKARKRGTKNAAVKSVAPTVQPAQVAEAARPEIVKAAVEVSEPDVAPAPREARKVRVIPLYHTPDLN